MSKTDIRIILLFVALTIAGFVLAAGIAPRQAGADQLLLVGTGMGLFASGLTTFLLRFTKER